MRSVDPDEGARIRQLTGREGEKRELPVTLRMIVSQPEKSNAVQLLTVTRSPYSSTASVAIVLKAIARPSARTRTWVRSETMVLKN